MKIWLVTIGEPIFHPKNKLRLHRTGILSKYIAENSEHEVVWWTSTFSHFTKEHLYNSDTIVDVMPRLKMIAIKGKGYKRNISFDRIIDHGQIAKKFELMIKQERKPEIIIAAFPTIGLCKAALKYGKLNDIPVIIDYRDMWPEVYIDVIPRKLQFVGRKLFIPLFNEVAEIFKNAYGIIGITQDFLSIALKKIGRLELSSDGVFPLGYLMNQYNDIDIAEAAKFWESTLNINSNRLRICFFGAIGYQSNWETIREAVLRIHEEKIDVEFIICGSGDKLQSLKESTFGIDNIIFPGFVSAAQIRSLMDFSDIGLCAYFPKESYLNSIPGKAIEYMSSGLPILSTLKDGTLGKLIDKYNIGFHYEHDSVESLINALKNILVQGHKLNEMSKVVNKIYTENFDANHVYKNYTKHLENVVKQYQISR